MTVRETREAEPFIANPLNTYFYSQLPVLWSERSIVFPVSGILSPNNQDVPMNFWFPFRMLQVCNNQLLYRKNKNLNSFLKEKLEIPQNVSITEHLAFWRIPTFLLVDFLSSELWRTIDPASFIYCTINLECSTALWRLHYYVPGKTQKVTRNIWL
jgi:hypothetical protein